MGMVSFSSSANLRLVSGSSVLAAKRTASKFRMT
jgi:hypothetical protein